MDKSNKKVTNERYECLPNNGKFFFVSSSPGRGAYFGNCFVVFHQLAVTKICWISDTGGGYNLEN